MNVRKPNIVEAACDLFDALFESRVIGDPVVGVQKSKNTIIVYTTSLKSKSLRSWES